MAVQTTNPLDVHLEQINARLLNAVPHAAYALGILTVVHMETGKPIPNVMLDAAMGVNVDRRGVPPGEQVRDYAVLTAPKAKRKR